MPHPVKKVCLATEDSDSMKNESYTAKVRQFLKGAQDQGKIHQNTPDGFMELSVYSILPGIYLTLNDIHTQVIPANMPPLKQGIFVVNYCMDGRCEFKLDENNYSYLDSRMMNVSTGIVPEQFFYPSSYYQGYEIYVLSDWFTAQTKSALELFSIRTEDLNRLYGKGSAFYVPEELLRLWNAITECRECDDIGGIRLYTLQLLKYLSEHKPDDTPNILYLTKVQVLLAKKVQEILTGNLSKHISMRSIAESLNVSETSLKRYFYCVYGVNVSSYMNEMRMKYAAELLTTSTMSIADIAKACGYVNQGRFANVFFRFYGSKPLDYRRSSRILS